MLQCLNGDPVLVGSTIKLVNGREVIIKNINQAFDGHMIVDFRALGGTRTEYEDVPYTQDGNIKKGHNQAFSFAFSLTPTAPIPSVTLGLAKLSELEAKYVNVR
jgi:hypothetical protein